MFTWSVEEVCTWLGSIGCADCADSFRRQHVIGAVLPSLDDTVLEVKLLVSSYGQRQTILLARDWLLQQVTIRELPPSSCPSPANQRSPLPSPLSKKLSQAATSAKGVILNATAEQVLLWTPGIFIFGLTFFGGLALMLSLQANPWFLLWLSPSLFFFLLLAMQKATNH